MFINETVNYLLFFSAVFAGFVDSIAGGGGLITIPCMIIAGIPPLQALATNRLQTVMGELTSAIIYFKHGSIIKNNLITGILMVSLGAILGSYSVSLISPNILKLLLPIMMTIILIYIIFSKKIRENISSKSKISRLHLMVIGGIILGFYNGFFGPGTGSLWIVALILLNGLNIKNASINSKPLNLASNILSLITFIYLGLVYYKIGIIMGLGQIIGAYIGSHLVLKNGDRIVRPVFIIVTAIMIIKLVYDGISTGDYFRIIN